jgi:hypothetical protein
MALTRTSEIDAEVGRLAGDINASQKFRDHTIRWAKACLKLSEMACATPENSIIAFFKVIGDAALGAYTFGKYAL